MIVMDGLDVDKIKKEIDEKLGQVKDIKEFLDLRVEYLGKKGKFKNWLDQLKNLSTEQKREFGSKLNKLKNEIEKEFSEMEKELSESKSEKYSELYKSLPGKKPEIGHLHVTTQAIREIVDIFKPLGFTRIRYPEVEWDYYAFEALNMHKDHPARDEWETFFVDIPENKEMGKAVITPHTSSGQVREMLKGNLPIRMLNISRCGRRQTDISHGVTFFQFEGLVIDKGINISHLKGVLNYFAKNFFGEDRKTRLRPYDFRFTEPSFEADIDCSLCHGKGCKFCKEGWLELGGAGMVHPSVLKAGGIDPNEYTGFAFGWGVERVYMMKSGTQIDDIRHLFNNDLRFLEQF